ncbi:MAG TPA: methylated-DNA--[protein]-cysteine S-methyltransferase [Actinocrinis sp.]
MGTVTKKTGNSATQAHSLAVRQMETPLGTFTLLVDGDAVRGAGFTADVDEMIRIAGVDAASVRRDGRSVDDSHPAIAAVQAYFEGDLRAVDKVAVIDRPRVGPFTKAAREALRAIPPGTTLSYTQLAAEAGNVRAVRAAGAACASNPVALIVPCHRVVRTDGSLSGYLYGLEIKQRLLDYEAAGVRHGADAGEKEK